MFEFILSNLSTIVVGVFVATVLIIVGAKLFYNIKYKKCACQCNCANCPNKYKN